MRGHFKVSPRSPLEVRMFFSHSHMTRHPSHGKPIHGSGKLFSIMLVFVFVLAVTRQLTFLGTHSRAPIQYSVARAATTLLEETPEVDDQERVLAFEKAQVIDEAALLAASEFPISPEELITKAKIYLAYGQGVEKPELLAKDFEFVGPVVGPLGKSQYLNAVGGFQFYEAFPDANAEFHHFRVDPFEASRVWFTSRGKGTNTGDAPGSPLFAKPTGKGYVNPPQACSIRFNADGKVNQYTIGYVMDRRIGNTGGLGGIYGIAYAMGKPLPFPEAQPWKPSWRYSLFIKLGSVLQKLKPKGTR